MQLIFNFFFKSTILGKALKQNTINIYARDRSSQRISSYYI